MTARLTIRDFVDLTPEESAAIFAEMTPAERAAKLYDWSFWARDDQMLPEGDWVNWLPLAGRGWGKTRVGAETVRAWIKMGFRHVNLIGPTESDVEKVMVKGESGILAVCPPEERPIYVGNKHELRWPNGARSLLFSAEKADRLRGNQHEKLWCFCAGTMIPTPQGERPIETIREGDLVRTRFGFRRVLAAGNREADVGRVSFSHGQHLIGTADHPVLTTYGWTTLASLSTGQSVATDTWEPISAPRAQMAGDGASTSTGGFGLASAALFLLGWTFTTATKTRSITKSTISNFSLMRRIARFTRGIRPAVEEFSFAAPSLQSASVAPAISNSADERRPRSASGVTRSPPTRSERPSGPASIAEHGFCRSEASFAASVASTWVPVGLRTVYNLTVDGEHEFIANGVVVHNCDELAAWRYTDAWDQAMLGLRLGSKPQVLITTTPRPTKIIKELRKDRQTHFTSGSTYENAANLADVFISKVVGKYEGTRLGRQELGAEILDDMPGALFNREQIDRDRIAHRKLLPQMTQVVVAIDPAVSTGEDADETGIMACGVGDDKHGYVLEDASGIYSPTEWAREAVRLYRRWHANKIVAEVNNGGDMVGETIRMEDPNILFKPVHATRGKVMRAEPISLLYEQHRVHHLGTLAKLEDQLCVFTSDFDRAASGYSPDRLDAMVWGLHELMIGPGTDGFLNFYGDMSKAAAAAREAEKNGDAAGQNHPAKSAHSASVWPVG